MLVNKLKILVNEIYKKYNVLHSQINNIIHNSNKILNCDIFLGKKTHTLMLIIFMTNYSEKIFLYLPKSPYENP